jgi:hypothetical protein
MVLLGISCSDNDLAMNNEPLKIEQQEMPVDLSTVLEVYSLPEDGAHNGFLLDPEDAPPDIADTSYDVYSVILVWGNPDPTTVDATAPAVNWSGTLAVNGVAWVVPVKTILFEPSEDSVLANSGPSQSAWASTTHGHFDGISFLVYLKRGIIYIAEPRLSFITAPITQSWDFEQLKRLSVCYRTNAGNILGVRSRLIKRVYCPQGLLAGHWAKNPENHMTGRFEGVWLERNSDPVGHYSGHFWQGDDGIGRFEGSVSGYITDQVIAEFKGEWYYDDPSMCPTCGENKGVFKGRVKWLTREAEGELWGEIGPPLTNANFMDLPMAGFWRVNCRDSESSLPD